MRNMNYQPGEKVIFIIESKIKTGTIIEHLSTNNYGVPVYEIVEDGNEEHYRVSESYVPERARECV